MIENPRRFVRGNLVFLFVVGLLVGMIAKKTIGDHVRIGFEDPQTYIDFGTLVDIDILEQKLISDGLPEEIVDQADQVITQ